MTSFWSAYIIVLTLIVIPAIYALVKEWGLEPGRSG
mgnify:CR=1 FL=1